MTAPGVPAGMVVVPGGSFTMGCDTAYPEEAPAHPVTVSSFAIDVTPVTNAMFGQFVETTGYVTVAERGPDPSDFPGTDPALLVPGSAVFVQPSEPVNLNEPFRWWAYQPGVSWRTPFGGSGGSSEQRPLELVADAPVVHVAYADAIAFAMWRGVRLPTEAEFEWAAWGERQPTSLGTAPPPDAHTWRGEFPWRWDGPGVPGPRRVGADPNAYGVSDLLGNVWEWTDDWFDHRHALGIRPCCAPVDPRGPSAASVFDPALPTVPFKVAKGGSFLCSPDYCARYRPSARLGQAVDTSTGHLGFRCAAGLNPASGVS